MDEMGCFFKRVSDDIVEQCRSTMFHENINFSRLTVHAQLVKGSRLIRMIRETKRTKSFKSGSSKGKLVIQDSLDS